MRRRAARRIGTALAAVVACAGGLAWVPSASAAAAPAGSFTAAVPGTRAFVAVVVARDRDAVAFVCDGRRVALWFRGRATRTSFVLRTGAKRMRLRVDRGRATGTMRLGGRERRFAALRVRRPAGLYRAHRTVRGKRHLGGWVVLPDGRQRGAVRVGSQTRAAPLVHPAAAGGVTVAGVRLRPRYVGTSADL